MKKLIVVLFTLMLSNSALAIGEMGKGDCTDSDNGSRKVVKVEDLDQETVTTTTQEEENTVSQ